MMMATVTGKKMKNTENIGNNQHNHVHMASHSVKLKSNMVNRLNRIEGQIRGLARMIDEDVYCDDILNQIFSVEAALAGVKKTLLEAHVKGCVLNQIKQGDENVIDELLATMGKMIK